MPLSSSRRRRRLRFPRRPSSPLHRPFGDDVGARLKSHGAVGGSSGISKSSSRLENGPWPMLWDAAEVAQDDAANDGRVAN